ncbi:alpha beta-hydrolase [Chlorella sorokiniana]|uniref:Alpha beta-hydrolase n=1 Tax=Chlorella sorokiniana TaxID=3076 RepID=A0A2P6TPG6_CHLSO|nr:alpha beta-hydrolase [Chlorella sorokiniana]|eukprot:PRW55924.1 alpha beta-hydrolase [Chlorella sorokiniana]
MPVSFTGCCLWGLGSAADWLGLHKPLPAVRGDEHALPVEGCGQSQQGQSQQGQSQQGQSQQGQSQQGQSQQGSPEPSPARHANGSASTHGGKAGGGEEASASTSPASKSGRGSLRKLPVVLRVEVASKISAQVLTWGVIVINTLFVWLAIVLLSLRQSDTWTVGQLRPYYQAEVVLGSIALGSLLLAGLWFGLSVWRSTREQRVWSKRQRYFGSTAAVLLALQSGYSAAYVASYGVVLSATNCAYPFNTLSVLEFVQWAFFISAMLFLLARLHNVMVYRGLGALDMHPNFRLVVDRPLSERPRQNKWILIAWAVLVMLGVLNMIDKFRRYPHLFPNPRCDIELNKLQCPPNAIQISTASVYLVIILLFVAYWLHSLYHATRDHELLPWHKYRMSLIYIRIQARVFGPVISAVILSTIFLGLIPSFTNSCWAAIDAQLGNLPVDLALSLAAIIMSLLYAPKARALDSPMLQDFFQAFAWTEAGLEKAVERRNRQLLDPGSSTTTSSNTGWPGLTTQVSFTRVVEAVESAAAYLPGKMAQLAGVQDPETAAAKLREEPCFCMEAAVKLFYWMRLAYREDDVLDHKFVNAAGGLELFDLQHFETIWDESTDTHCVVGWSDTTCVVAFRGTQTMQNVLTDLKAWMAPLQPEAHHNGTLCKVHAGFLSAWLHHGFSEKVLARLRELDSNKGQPLRFWVCGHSLGGALATLAALRIRQQHPMSQLTVITYGCPRVGNRAFSTLFDQTVSDCWAIVNDLDPIPWVPKWCFHRVGKRVIIDGRGNLILRPSYFEVSVTHRGTSAKHHLTGGYALSLAAIFRAQFVPSKALLGGAQGVAALEAAVDLGKALQLTNMDLESLRDPAKLPELSEVLAAKREAQRRSRAGSSRRQLSRSLSCGNASLLPACCDTRPAVRYDRA